RDIQKIRSIDPNSKMLPHLYRQRLTLVYFNSGAWLVGCLGLYFYTGSEIFLWITPLTAWLFGEQITQIWNAIYITDGRARHVVSVRLFRRLPALSAVAITYAFDGHLFWAWSPGMAGGTALTWISHRHRQEEWARQLVPRPWALPSVQELSLAYWWSQIGQQLREFQLPLLMAT